MPTILANFGSMQDPNKWNWQGGGFIGQTAIRFSFFFVG
jgi:hypothetical protein